MPAPHGAAPGHPRCHRQPTHEPIPAHPRTRAPWVPEGVYPKPAIHRPAGAPRAGGLPGQGLPVSLSQSPAPPCPGGLRGGRHARGRDGASGALPAGPARGRCGPGPSAGALWGSAGTAGPGEASVPRPESREAAGSAKMVVSATTEELSGDGALISSGFPAWCGAGGSALSSAAALHPVQQGRAAEGAPVLRGQARGPRVLSLGKRKLRGDRVAPSGSPWEPF